jgi:TRAP-type C4-dicarboxylate transport system permease small subunit
MIVLVIAIAAEVFARYVMNSSLSWSEEFGRILFVWVIFLGTSIGFKRGAHMGLHFITEMTPAPIRKVIQKISIICSAVFFLFIVIQGISVTLKMTSQATPALGISAAWQLSAIPVGALIILIHAPSLLFHSSSEVGVTHDLDSAG